MQYIVVYDDQCSLCIPMGKDPDCEGAVCTTNGTIALFDTRKDAETAIKISKLFANLRLLQGKPCNTEFTEYVNRIRIMKAEKP